MILNPISTEKAIRLMESENKLMFVVEKKDTKQTIKAEVEKLFKVKVEKVNTFISPKGDKKAYVKLSSQDSAMDIATQMGMI